ncbi:MAG TPA: response regulator [Gemmatimonadales bacterium]|nr:response regulator [Gemmatimonadales bacterium]
MPGLSSVVFVVDDDESLRRSLERLLRVSGYSVQTFSSAAAFLEQPEPDCPSCLLLDIRMPELTGLDVQQAINQERPAISVILMTGFADMESCILGMKAGAADFLLKPFDDDQLLEAVATALANSKEVRHSRAEYQELHQRFDLLTPRERQVFELVAEGLLNKQIAGRLGTREGTVKLHRANLIRKLQARSVSDLVRMADRLRHDSAPQRQPAQASA